MIVQIAFTAWFIIYITTIIYLLVSVFRESLKYLIAHKNIRKHVFVLYGILILAFLCFIIPELIDLFSGFRSGFLLLSPECLEDRDIMISISPLFMRFISVLLGVLFLYGLVHFPIKLSAYLKYRKTENEHEKRFAFANVILMTIFTLVLFWFAIQPFTHIYSKMCGGANLAHCLPFPTFFYISLSNLLYKYWFVGVIPIIGFILFETQIKLNKELKILIYQFISYSCVLNMLLAGGSLFMPMMPL